MFELLGAIYVALVILITVAIPACNCCTGGDTTGCSCCAGGAPKQWTLVISGITGGGFGECHAGTCSALNGTYTLTYASDPGHTVCTWSTPELAGGAAFCPEQGNTSPVRWVLNCGNCGGAPTSNNWTLILTDLSGGSGSGLNLCVGPVGFNAIHVDSTPPGPFKCLLANNWTASGTTNCNMNSATATITPV